MLAIKRSVGVAPEVNLRNQLCEKAHKRVIYPGFETRSPKQGISGLTNFFLEKKNLSYLKLSMTDLNEDL